MLDLSHLSLIRPICLSIRPVRRATPARLARLALFRLPTPALAASPTTALFGASCPHGLLASPHFVSPILLVLPLPLSTLFARLTLCVPSGLFVVRLPPTGRWALPPHLTPRPPPLGASGLRGGRRSVGRWRWGVASVLAALPQRLDRGGGQPVALHRIDDHVPRHHRPQQR
jgi:hypothetical protein